MANSFSLLNTVGIRYVHVSIIQLAAMLFCVQCKPTVTCNEVECQSNAVPSINWWSY